VQGFDRRVVGGLQTEGATALDDLESFERTGLPPFGSLERIETRCADQHEVVIGTNLCQLAFVDALPEQALADRRRCGERKPEIDEWLVWLAILRAEQL